jgi:hypothetical protein
MNLIQIQDHLKDLPTQTIISYSNGQNPEVPPYIALGEMNRRKNMEQRAAQAPNSSVKEQLESELNQQVALPGIGQGMNMKVNPAGMPQPMPAAQPQMAPKMPGMAIQPAARPTPPQQMAQAGSIPAGAPGMAAGGLAELPVRKDIFNYAPGGIVAFADESNDQVVGLPLPPGAPSEKKYSADEMSGIDKLPVGLANQILRSRLMGQTDLPEPASRDEARAEVLAKKPELASIIDKLPGDTLTKLAEQLQQQNLAQRDKFKESEGPRGLAALSDALIRAGESTRGQKGFGNQLGSALGGFGQSYNASTVAAEERAAKQQAMERAQTIETMKLQSDIEQMQRAYAENRIDDAMKLKEQINARKAKIEEIKGTAAKDTLTQYGTQLQREEQARHNKENEKHQAAQASAAAETARYARENRPSAEDKLLGKIQSNVAADKAYQTLAKRLESAEINSEEYYKILDAMHEIALTYYPKDAKGVSKVPPPPAVNRVTNPEKPEEQGFWDKLIYGAKPAPSAVKPVAVPFDQLPTK